MLTDRRGEKDATSVPMATLLQRCRGQAPRVQVTESALAVANHGSLWETGDGFFRELNPGGFRVGNTRPRAGLGWGTGGVEISAVTPGTSALALCSAPDTPESGGHAFQKERPQRKAVPLPTHLHVKAQQVRRCHVPRGRDLFSNISF